MAPHGRTLLVAAVISFACLRCAVARELQTLGRRIQAQCDQSTFQAITPSIITKGPVIDLQWLDKDDKKVLAITKKANQDAGGFWISDDGGKNWLEQSGALNAWLPANQTLEIVIVFAQKSNPANLFILGSGSWYWTSSDYGKTVTGKQTLNKWRGFGVQSFKLHPTQENWLLLLVERPGCKVYDWAQMDCPMDLLMTHNLFSDNPLWTNLTAASNGQIAGFVDFDWGRNLCPDRSCDTEMKITDSTILATTYAKAGDYDHPWDPDVSFAMSDDLFQHTTNFVKCGNMFEIIGKSVYLAKSNACPDDVSGADFPQGSTLYTSQDGGRTFTQACLPVAIKQYGSDLLETHDGTGAIIIVYYVSNNMPASSVYTAGPHHALFSLSLTGVYRPKHGAATDFSKIEGLPGVYIANQMISRLDDDYGMGDDASSLVETRITFNGGGRWRRIQAPLLYNNKQCNQCGDSPECYLHLHGMSSWDRQFNSMPAVYSNPSAPGIIMASGNTALQGMGLDINDGACTWLSTDGGETWKDVAVGTYIYEYADWGGFIIMARHPGRTDKPADEVLFSYDGGQCWEHVPLSEAMLMDNIRIEPDGQRARVVLHGRRCTKSDAYKTCAYSADVARIGTEGIMYIVDMQDLLGEKMSRTCTADDHEQWAIPSDVGANVPRCALGRKTFNERRKWSSMCLNGADYKRPAPNQTPCNCTVEADLECDYGYIRSDTTCVKIEGFHMPKCPAIDQLGYHVSSTGKRLVHADTCENVAGVLPDTDGKGQWQPGSGDGGGSKKRSGWFVFWMIILALVLSGGAFVGWWIYLATESQRDTVRDLAASASETASNVKHWVTEKVSGRRSHAVAEQDMGYFQPLADHNNVHDDGHNSLFTLK